MGCRLCASGLEGLVRNLSSGEMYDQVLGMQKDTGQRVSHLVLMGSGEPLDNYDATLAFIRQISAAAGLKYRASPYNSINLRPCSANQGAGS